MTIREKYRFKNSAIFAECLSFNWQKTFKDINPLQGMSNLEVEQPCL